MTKYKTTITMDVFIDAIGDTEEIRHKVVAQVVRFAVSNFEEPKYIVVDAYDWAVPTLVDLKGEKHG